MPRHAKAGEIDEPQNGLDFHVAGLGERCQLAQRRRMITRQIGGHPLLAAGLGRCGKDGGNAGNGQGAR